VAAVALGPSVPRYVGPTWAFSWTECVNVNAVGACFLPTADLQTRGLKPAGYVLTYSLRRTDYFLQLHTRYWSASARWEASMLSLPARSATVRATLRTRS
jgi:hypothetical protein